MRRLRPPHRSNQVKRGLGPSGLGPQVAWYIKRHGWKTVTKSQPVDSLHKQGKKLLHNFNMAITLSSMAVRPAVCAQLGAPRRSARATARRAVIAMADKPKFTMPEVNVPEVSFDKEAIKVRKGKYDIFEHFEFARTGSSVSPLAFRRFVSIRRSNCMLGSWGLTVPLELSVPRVACFIFEYAPKILCNTLAP